MEISFSSKKLAKNLSDPKDRARTYGPTQTAKILRRLDEIAAAPSLAHLSRLPPTRCHELSQNRKGQFSVDLNHPYRLLFIPANEPIPTKPDGGIDLDLVTEVEIIEITDTHE
ncbi:MAG: HigA [Verrucomicrobiota bacterium]|jgi:proteic killer suppression protein